MDKIRAVIALDDGSFESFPVVDLSEFLRHGAEGYLLAVGLNLLRSCGPAVGQEEVFFRDPHLIVFHSISPRSSCR